MIPSIWFLPLTLLIIVFLLNAASTLVGSQYNWDVDHMMYFGGRLLHGELVWIQEFDDKLPVVQFLFAIPAAFGSIRIWQLFSILSVLAAAGSIAWGVRLLLIRDWKLERTAATYFSLAAAGTYLYFTAVLPGNLSHINAMAASLVTIATMVTLVAARPGACSLRDFAGRLMIAALLASVAVSMRPYFFGPCAFTCSLGFNARSSDAPLGCLRS
jgi:hypothetical protein